MQIIGSNYIADDQSGNEVELPQLSNDIERTNSIRIEALRISLLSAEIAFESLVNQCRSIEKSSSERPSLYHSIQVLSTAWQIVDQISRCRKLAHQIRGLTQKSESFRSFIDNTKGVEPLRNGYQHVDNEVKRSTEDREPTSGALGWASEANNLNSITITICGGHGNNEYSGLAFDIENGRFQHNYLFSAFGIDLPLAEISKVVAEFRAFFEHWLAEKQWLKAEPIKTSILRFNVEFRKRPE